jgi:hypothetical protein
MSGAKSDEEMLQAGSSEPPSSVRAPDLSVLLITLLKGVIYRINDEGLWSDLLKLQTQVRDFFAILNLDLVVDDSEGYAFIKGRAESADDGSTARLPRLVARRPLSFSVSLLIALLRKKLAEFDAAGGETRLVLTRDEIVDLVRVFLPAGPNEAKLIDQIETTLNKVVDLGFLYPLKSTDTSLAGQRSYEVRRILKAFVDAQWLAEFDAKLSSYQTALSPVASVKASHPNE